MPQGFKAQVITPDRVAHLYPVHSLSYLATKEQAVDHVLSMAHERLGSDNLPLGTVVHVFVGAHGCDSVIQTRVWWNGWVVLHQSF